MATVLVCAASGGVVANEEVRFCLTIPARALAVDTTVTVAPVTIAAGASREVLAAWRLIAHPGPTLLGGPALVSVAIPPGASAPDLQLLVAAGARSLDDEWHALQSVTLGQGRIEAPVWYLPPSHGPPRQSSTLICLARKIPTI